MTNMETCTPTTDGNNSAVKGHGPQESIKFGMVDNEQVANGQTKEQSEINNSNNLPKDVVDEWPAPKQIHSFYFVKFRPYEDPKVKTKIEQIEKEIQRKNQARFEITDALKKKRSERSAVISQLKPLTAEDKGYRTIIDGKRKEMEPFQAALGKLRTFENKRRSEGLCSSEQELNDLIKSLHFRLQHESNTISEEKQILKDIKHLEATRDKVIGNSAVKVEIGDSFGKKEDMVGQVKQIGVDLDMVRKDQQAVRTKIRKLEEELKAIDDEISSLQEELHAIELKRGQAYESLNEVRKSRDGKNACFFQNRSLLLNVKNLAVKKDVSSLEELRHVEVENFMSQWNSDRAFRDDYEQRILSSLDGRQMTRDGRTRNPDEKPIMAAVVKTPEPEVSQPKANMRRPKEDGPQPEPEKLSQEAAQKEKAEGKKDKDVEKKTKAADLDEIDTSYEVGKPLKKPVTESIDPAKLKEIKREEEIAKAKIALERKKKQAEKAEAKAAARAQKEAEKKLKEKEKKARKKAAVSAPPFVENTEEETKAEEPEEAEPAKETVTNTKNKDQKENIRYRNRQRGPLALPKPVLKRKKSTSYLVWAVPLGILSVAIVLFGVYYQYGKRVTS